MADELDVLLEKVDDPILRADLRAAVDRVRAKRSFGLVFESHLPERVWLPDHPVRRGVKVVRSDGSSEPLLVHRVENGSATLAGSDGSTEKVDISDLVVIAEFGETIYPGLTRLGSIHRGGDKPAHVVINAENHHALELLQFTHAGRIDCIYIDPPYNSGARDWKYDNNYVDADDNYRHSKWLAFIERRLRLAKKLLNPEDSVLIVTIDEKEYLRLGLLLEQVFVGAHIEMVTTIISAKGAYRRGHFSRVEEHIFFVTLGSASLHPWISNMLPSYDEDDKLIGDTTYMMEELNSDGTELQPIEWLGLRRREPSAVRGARPNQFYPIFVHEGEGFLHAIGDPIDDDIDRESVDVPAGTVALWPLKPDGTEMLWGLTPEVLRRNWASGFARVSSWNRSKRHGTVKYLPSGTIDKIQSGEICITGRASDGAVEGYLTREATQGVTPKRVWHLPSHNAETGGTKVVSTLVPGRRFPYPKSLYAVEDSIRFAVYDKPNAIVLDFFAGSGTTTHAVMRLNRQDGGRRQSIAITNNEVSDREAARMTASGFRPGDAEWEATGIFEYVTRPRIEAVITGITHRGSSVEGSYSYVDPFPMSDGLMENVEFLKLTYLDPIDVELDRAYAAISPLLWIRAGAVGPMIDECLDGASQSKSYGFTDHYGVLFNPDNWRSFVDRLPESVRTVFVVTDSSTTFSGVAEVLPARVEAVRLYENYLTTFAINWGR